MRIVESLVACYLHTDEIRFLIGFGLASQLHLCHDQTFIIAIELIYLEGMTATFHQIATLIDDATLTKLQKMLRLVPVHFFSFPYTSELAKEKVLSLAKELTAYTGRMTLQIVPFTHIQEEIRRACPEEYFTLIMRRFMMRIAEDIAAHNECKAIVTGENLGQVASQTMEAMACTQDVTHLPVLQPLIGMDKRDIVKIAREIGTFDTSILPYEDCCTVFTPRHPKTRPTVAEVAEAESALDIDALVHEAVDGIERIRIDL